MTTLWPLGWRRNRRERVDSMLRARTNYSVFTRQHSINERRGREWRQRRVRSNFWPACSAMYLNMFYIVPLCLSLSSTGLPTATAIILPITDPAANLHCRQPPPLNPNANPTIYTLSEMPHPYGAAIKRATQ